MILTNNIIVLDEKVPLLSPNSDVHVLVNRGNLIRKKNQSNLPTRIQKSHEEQDLLFEDASNGKFAPREGSAAQGLGAPAHLSSDLRAQSTLQVVP